MHVPAENEPAVNLISDRENVMVKSAASAASYKDSNSVIFNIVVNENQEEAR